MIDLKDLKAGLRVKVTGNSANNAQVRIGSEYEVVSWTPHATHAMYHSVVLKGITGMVYSGDIELAVITKEQLEKHVADLERSLATAKLKLEYMATTGVEKIDELEFKTFSVLQAVKGEGSDLDKAKLIADLIRNC